MRATAPRTPKATKGFRSRANSDLVESESLSARDFLEDLGELVTVVRLEAPSYNPRPSNQRRRVLRLLLFEMAYVMNRSAKLDANTL